MMRSNVVLNPDPPVHWTGGGVCAREEVVSDNIWALLTQRRREPGTDRRVIEPPARQRTVDSGERRCKRK
jgi:hypothetical protein